MSNPDNQLMIFQSPEEFQYKFFTRDRAERTEEITNEQMMAEQKALHNQTANEVFFGGMGGTADDFINMYKDLAEDLKEQSKDEVVSVDKLQAETEDPYHLKELEADKTVFPRRTTLDRDPLTGNYRKTPDISSSNDYVQRNGAPPYGRSYGSAPSSTASGVGYGTVGYGNAASGPAQAQQPKPGDQSHIYTQIPRVQQNFMNVGMQTPVWSEEKRQDGWEKYKKKSFWRKTADWFKSKKGRIMVKVALLAALQLGMAVVGKKYSFEGWGQGFMFLTMMLGTFYITKELQADGFDPRGFGI